MGNLYKQVNLEAGKPYVEDAIGRLRHEIDYAKRLGGGCLYVIHGYGSHGSGGRIRDEVRRILPLMKEAGKIKSYAAGEDFNVFNADARNLRAKYSQLEPLMRMCNHGVTVIEI